MLINFDLDVLRAIHLGKPGGGACQITYVQYVRHLKLVEDMAGNLPGTGGTLV